MTLSLAFSLLHGGCTDETASSDCQGVCQREAACDERDKDEALDAVSFDQSECVAACATLEADKAVGQELVKNHVACVRAAGDNCAAVRQCR